MPSTELVNTEFSVLTLRKLCEIVEEPSTLFKLYSLGLCILLTAGRLNDSMKRFRDNLKTRMPLGMTSMRLLYYTGIFRIKGGELDQCVRVQTPKRISIVEVLKETQRLEFANLDIQSTKRRKESPIVGANH